MTTTTSTSGLLYYRRKLTSNDERQEISFLPGNKGLSSSTMASAETVEKAWPTSPRSDFLLKSLRIEGRVTAADLAVWEICMAAARDTKPIDKESVSDRVGRALKRQRFQISCDAIYALLGWKRKSRFLLQSLDRLEKATARIDLDPRVRRRLSIVDHGPEPMIKYDIIEIRGVDVLKFEIPEAVRELIARPGRYRQVELVAISKMSSRYSVGIYQQLLLKTWNNQVVPRPNGATFLKGYYAAVRPADLARRIGWLRDGENFSSGAFKREVLDRIAADLKHVRAFDTGISFQRDAGRGRSVTYVEFKMTPRTPDWRTLRTPSWQKERIIQLALPDVKDRHVKIGVLLRAESWFGVHASTLREAWLLALYEADISTPYDAGFDTKQYRGPRLLQILKERGPNDCFWSFIDEELRYPSLTVGDHWREDGERIEQARIRAVLGEADGRRLKVLERLESLIKKKRDQQVSHNEAILVALKSGADRAEILQALTAVRQNDEMPTRAVVVVDVDDMADYAHMTLSAGPDELVAIREIPGVEFAEIVAEPAYQIVESYEGTRAAKTLLGRIGDGPIEPYLGDVRLALADLDRYVDGRLMIQLDLAKKHGKNVDTVYRVLHNMLRRRSAESPQRIAFDIDGALIRQIEAYRRLEAKIAAAAA